MSDKIKRKIFSKFCDFINEYIQETDDNPSLEAVRSNHSSHTYLILRLKNVTRASSAFYRDIESFTPGTKLEMDDQVDGSGKIFMVMIPLRGARKQSRSNDYDDDEYEDEELPDLTSIFGLLVLLSGVITFASLTTEYSDWMFLLNK